MHVSFVSTYPPRPCGLATFTADLRGGVEAAGHSTDVVSVVHRYAATERRPEVAVELRQTVPTDYAAAAEALRGSSAQVVSVQHEFGIFGGTAGADVLQLLDGLRQPVVTTLHTVLPRPSGDQRAVVQALAKRSDRLVVMTESARALLVETYGIEAGRVGVIPHGTPDRDPRPAPGLRERLGLGGRRVLLTFGLLGPSKGIELALDALPAVVEADPSVLYVVLGATHPDIVARDGEAYRDALRARVAARGMGAHVRFVDEYVTTEALWDWLTASDVYVSPYPGLDQACSGTLAYALAAGLPVVSTPYAHAREVLAGGAGRLVDVGDEGGFSAALRELVLDDDARAEAARRALAFGSGTRWTTTGAAYAEAFAEALAGRAERARRQRPADLTAHPAALPAALAHLGALTDGTGPFQHAAFGVPDRANGYCTDDAGRALVAALAFADRDPTPRPDLDEARRVARTCLSFIAHAQAPDGRFHNMMGYGGRFVDDPQAGDTVGRALWGLGAAVCWGADDERSYARATLSRSLAVELHAPLAIAYAMLGLTHALDRLPCVSAYRARLREHTAALLSHYRAASRPGWPWVSDAMTYANALVPHALLRASSRLSEAEGAAEAREAALATLDFVLDQTVRDGVFEGVGNRGWLPRGGEQAVFDQQPIEAGYAAWAWAEAAETLGEPRYARAARLAAAWFDGRNRIGEPVLDAGGAYDGFGPQGVNRNRGAESAIAALLARLATAPPVLASETPATRAKLAGPAPVAS